VLQLQHNQYKKTSSLFDRLKPCKSLA